MPEPLDITTTGTALVVIDLQKGIVGMPTAPHSADDVVGNAVRLAKAFRERNMPVVLVRVTPSPDMKDRLAPKTDGPGMAFRDLPTDWAAIVPEMGPEDGDIVLTKRQWGAFTGTELDLQLRRRGIDTIVLCGISTNIGVESTARFAYEYAYEQVFVEDAMAARTKEEHAHAVETTFARIGRVRSTSEVLAALDR